MPCSAGRSSAVPCSAGSRPCLHPPACLGSPGCWCPPDQGVQLWDGHAYPQIEFCFCSPFLLPPHPKHHSLPEYSTAPRARPPRFPPPAFAAERANWGGRGGWGKRGISRPLLCARLRQRDSAGPLRHCCPPPLPAPGSAAGRCARRRAVLRAGSRTVTAKQPIGGVAPHCGHRIPLHSLYGIVGVP